MDFLTLSDQFLYINIVEGICVGTDLRIVNLGKRKWAIIVMVLLHYIQRVTIEDAHQPGTKRASRLKTWQSAPCQQKSSLRDLLCQCSLVAEIGRAHV